MSINWPLVLVAPLFFLTLLASLYLLAWLLVALLRRSGEGRYNCVGMKHFLMTALVTPPVLAAIPTVAGIFMRHQHTATGLRHHSNLCSAVFVRMMGLNSGPDMTSVPEHVAAGIAVNGIVWILSIVGAIGVLRLGWATFRLERRLAVVLRPQSCRLEASLRRLQRYIPRRRQGMFFEADLPKRLSGLVGVRPVRCVLSSELVQTVTDDELDAVIAHEVTHLRNGDVIGTLLVGGLERLFFYLRPLHLLAQQWRDEAELACDLAASKITGHPLTLAAAILKAYGTPATVARENPGNLLIAGFAMAKACVPERRVESLIALAEEVTRSPIQESRLAAMAAWIVTGAIAALGLLLLVSPQVACYAHCTLEVVAKALP